MSFSYDFTLANDTVHFAYSIPYSYSRLLKLISQLSNMKELTPLRSLSGLPIPVVEIRDQNDEQFNKHVVLVTGRVHPGQSNSSYVAQGMLQFLCGNDASAKEIRKNYIFYIIPMLNPDGVIAGNYRTSLFGKDLNRTFDQSRKFAFPQTYFLVDFARHLKQKHKKRFNLYIDLHGHSVKKNVFMYGPDFGIQHTHYQLSRQLPKIIANLTSMFRFYSCIFRISTEKMTTARAIFNRSIDVPFTFTMQSSNGFYYDSASRTQLPFTAKKWRLMGIYFCKALLIIKFDQPKLRRVISQKIQINQEQPHQHHSDDDISQGKSDSEPEVEDLSQKELQKIENSIEGKIYNQKYGEQEKILNKQIAMKFSTKSPKMKKQQGCIFLPPINTSNRAMVFLTRNKKKEMFKQQKLRYIDSQGELSIDRYSRPRNSISQVVCDLSKPEIKPIIRNKKQFKVEIHSKFRISK